MSDPSATPTGPAPGAQATGGGAPPHTRVRIKKRRLLAVGLPLIALAMISMGFGMMMAVAADLPSLEQLPQVASRKNSILYDAQKRPLTTLTSNEGRVIVSSKQISPNIKNAVIGVEDERFYSNAGVDLRGIARAFYQDVIKGGAVQGGSTITQQFVKYARKTANNRTIFEKAREAALAFHLTRNWSKDKILTEYLNSIYFGNGAYGIEAAARTYFGSQIDKKGCGERGSRTCASLVTPPEAAMLAAIIASPAAFDPIAHPVAAKRRRDVVLRKMHEQGKISADEYEQGLVAPIPTELTLPKLDTPGDSEYFVSWVRQSLVDHVGAQRAFEGNLRVRTTLDLDMQRAAENAIKSQLSWEQGPTAAMVVIDNASGEVRAMVGGRDYNSQPFNLATLGQRQPGSAMKPFILARALADGISPGNVYPSKKREFKVPNGGGEVFVVNNFDKKYLGSASIADALTYSDNSIFAALGIQIGTKRVASLAKKMGIRTPISTNYAMTLGGLKQGVTPLDMAHAYETFASGGLRVGGTLGTDDDGPVGISSISRWVDEDQKLVQLESNRRKTKRVLSPAVAASATNLLTGPVNSGSAKRAQYGGFAAGKTGTTENSGDAWFVGFTRRWTIAVWVGYPNGLKPMLTEFGGDAVTGGTFPALIWRNFVLSAEKVLADRAAKEAAKKAGEDNNVDTVPGATGPTEPPTDTTTPLPDDGGETPEQQTTPADKPSAPKQQAPNPPTKAPKPPPAAAPKPPPAPTPAPTPTPDPGGAPVTGGASPTG
jgi:penicillin-binding protein 1A